MGMMFIVGEREFIIVTSHFLTNNPARKQHTATTSDKQKATMKVESSSSSTSLVEQMEQALVISKGLGSTGVYDDNASLSCTISTLGTDWTPERIVDENGQVFQSHLMGVADRRRWEIHNSVVDVIGQTPIIQLHGMKDLPKDVQVYVKCENMNPGGSLKDRLALGIIEWAEKTGRLQPGQTVVEASSGNTGKHFEIF